MRTLIIIALLLTCSLGWSCSACDEWAKSNGGKPPKEVYLEGYNMGYKVYKETHCEYWDTFNGGWEKGYRQAEKDSKKKSENR